jgi:uncharacterized repeat protein (TIGR01451 family)
MMTALRREACGLLMGMALALWPGGAGADSGEILPRVECVGGYVATICAEGLRAPDGLAFNPDGVLHVAEERAGQVSRVAANGSVTPVLNGLSSPEGIAFDAAGNLYVVEDVDGGRLVKMTPGGVTTTLATDRDAPEGVVWAADGTLYITESNFQFESSPFNWRSHVTAVSPGGEVTRVLSNARLWSYAGITIGPGGSLYVTNEIARIGVTDSIFAVEPTTGARTPFAAGLVTPEGLRFSPGGGFPLYVVEEDLGEGAGRLSRVEADGSHVPFCTGFLRIEDVALDGEGRLYVSEDGSGSIIRLKPTITMTMTQAAVPPHGSAVAPGERITYTLAVTNSGSADVAGLRLTDTLPTGVSYVPGSARAAAGLNIAAVPPPTLVLTGTLPADTTLTATLGVTVSRVASGTLLVNRVELGAGGTNLITSTGTHRVVEETGWRNVFLPVLLRGVSVVTPAAGRR